MLIEDGLVRFGEWFPDLPFYSNPGLVEAKNVIPVDGSYTDFNASLTADDALAAAPVGAYATVDDAGDPEIYAGTTTNLYEKIGASWTDRTPAPYTTASTDYWRFSQFDNYVVATNAADVPQRKVIGAAANFANLATTGSAPRARQVGVINRFIVLGDIDDGTAYPYAVQWCAINDITNWPTPNSAAARTVESGRQLLKSGHGAVTGIGDGQFFGLVFQKRAVTRVTYIGGDKVFQFETFEEQRGCWAPQSLVRVGGLFYFLAHDGWCMTDGQSVIPIGDSKIDKWFYSRVDTSRLKDITAGVDWINKCILWNFPSSAATAGTTDLFAICNFAAKNKPFSWAEETVQVLLQSYTQSYTLEQLDSLFTSIDDMTVSLDSPLWQGGTPTLMLFKSSMLGTLSGASKDATFETGEVDGNPFGYTFVRGIRPLVTGDPTTISVQIGTRNTQDNAGRTFGSAVTRTTRTGVCDFRVNGRFITARTNIIGGFDRALGIGVDHQPSSQV